jgi:hypothetical protein
MKRGVIYKFQPGNKINGTLFYCFEYYNFINQYEEIKFYIIGISPHDVELVKRIFSEKYTVSPDFEVLKSPIELYKLNLDRTLILDVRTWFATREFCTNSIQVFSNYDHDEFRFKNDRTVTYYGSYDYQKYDKHCLLKINFDIFREIAKSGYGVFVSSNDPEHIKKHADEYHTRFDKPVILKKSHAGVGNVLELVDQVHYVHTQLDTNNRIIPEAFFYNKEVTIESIGCSEVDSIDLRYHDIKENGLSSYTMAMNDVMIEDMLK